MVRGTSNGHSNVSRSICTPKGLASFEQYWTEKAYPSLVYYNKVDNGGHCAAWEQP